MGDVLLRQRRGACLIIRRPDRLLPIGPKIAAVPIAKRELDKPMTTKRPKGRSQAPPVTRRRYFNLRDEVKGWFIYNLGRASTEDLDALVTELTIGVGSGPGGLREVLNRWELPELPPRLVEDLEKLEKTEEAIWYRENREFLENPADMGSLPLPDAAASIEHAVTEPKRRRASGAGRKRAFTDAEINSLRETMRCGYAQEASLRGNFKAAGQYLRPLLPEAKRDVGLETLTPRANVR